LEKWRKRGAPGPPTSPSSVSKHSIWTWIVLPLLPSFFPRSSLCPLCFSPQAQEASAHSGGKSESSNPPRMWTYPYRQQWLEFQPSWWTKCVLQICLGCCFKLVAHVELSMPPSLSPKCHLTFYSENAHAWIPRMLQNTCRLKIF
jgi:hypothetical protein